MNQFVHRHYPVAVVEAGSWQQWAEPSDCTRDGSASGPEWQWAGQQAELELGEPQEEERMESPPKITTYTKWIMKIFMDFAGQRIAAKKLCHKFQVHSRLYVKRGRKLKHDFFEQDCAKH